MLPAGRRALSVCYGFSLRCGLQHENCEAACMCIISAARGGCVIVKQVRYWCPNCVDGNSLDMSVGMWPYAGT